MQENDFSDFVATCQVGLRRKNVLVIQAARDFVEHHNTVIRYFREATNDVEKAFQRVSVANIAGNAILLVGYVLAIVGGIFLATYDVDLVLPPGIFLLGLAVLLQLAGGITTSVALIGDVAFNHVVRERANEWITDVNADRDHVIQAHAEYCELRNQIIEEYDCSNDEVIQISLAYTSNKEDPKFELPDYFAANPKDKITTGEVAKALVSGVQIIGISLVWLLCLAGVMCITPLINHDIYNPDYMYLPIVLLGYLSSIFATIFAVAIVFFICKTGYSIYRSDKGTRLSRKLQATAQALELEAEELRPLSLFVIPHTCTTATCKELRNRIDQQVQSIHTLAQQWDAGVEHFHQKANYVRKTVACIEGFKMVGMAIASLTDVVKFIVGIYLLVHTPVLNQKLVWNSDNFWQIPEVRVIFTVYCMECFGSCVALCAVIADVVTRNRTLKHSNKWIDNSIKLRGDLLRRFDGYCEELNSVKQSVNADVHQAVFGHNYERPDSTAREILRTGHTARITMKWRWWKVLELMIQVVNVFLGGPFIYLGIIFAPAPYIAYFSPPYIFTSLGIASICLGALLILVNIPIYIKTICDLKAMELHRKLQDVARGLAGESEELRILARFADDA